MKNKELADCDIYFPTDKERLRIMSKIVEDFVKDIVTDEMKKVAVRMIESGKLTFDEIAEYLDLPLDMVKELSRELHSV